MAPRAVTSTGCGHRAAGHRGGAGHPRPRLAARAGRVLLPQTMRHEAIVLLRPLCHLWAEPAEDSEDEEEEEEEVENKDPPKKLKKKLPKEAASGESREKKLKPRGECPGDKDDLSLLPSPLSPSLLG